MTQALYQTTRSAAGLRIILKKLLITVIILVLSIWLADPAWKIFKSSFLTNSLNLVLTLRILLLTVMLFATQRPFAIYPDYISISNFVPVKLKKARMTFEGRGISKKNNQICLIVRHDTAEKPGELRIPWGLIAEPQHEVLQKIDELLFDDIESFES